MLVESASSPATAATDLVIACLADSLSTGCERDMRAQFHVARAPSVSVATRDCGDNASARAMVDAAVLRPFKLFCSMMLRLSASWVVLARYWLAPKRLA